MDEHGRTIRVVAAMIAEDQRYLITRRRSTAVLPLLWEFPGGRVEADETDEAALRREFEGRLGVDVMVGKEMSRVTHPYEHYTVELVLYECALVSSSIVARGVSEFRWVNSEEFDEYEFTPADEASMTQLLGLGGD